ncbi:unnamed protein product [Clonostachys byssicola]|uniref:Carrier domain-containing protein n=1 Tax=Clonostachys byssicola TaxID=160290 RepID=A0A9N9UAA1_9HYPO|nr:unnamed protein product [Clonostachys byssicola]
MESVNNIKVPLGASGRRLLPHVVDEIAAKEPDRTIYSFTRSKDPKHGFQNVTAQELARAINRCAWYIAKELGTSDQGFPTIAYMGPQDVVYAILILASVKAGYKTLLSSVRNTSEAHLHLLEKTDCRIFARPASFPLPAIDQLVEIRPMRIINIPELGYWLGRNNEYDAYGHFAYTKTYASARLEPLCVLHTSGSTGMPKPIIHTHGCASAIDAYSSLPSIGLQPVYPGTCKGRRVYLGFPLFHVAGIANFISGPLFVGYTVVLGPYPPSPEVINGIHVFGDVQEACLPPATLCDLSENPEYLRNLSQLDRVVTGGGPLPRQTGDLLAAETNLLNCIGTTECGGLPVQDCFEDWQYIKLSPCLGQEYRHFSGDLFEQVIVRREDLEAYQGVFSTFPDLEEWHMKDLYSPHPSKEGLWLYRGRTDDIITFSTGEKLNPLEMEGIIESHPSVKACLVCGVGQFQASLLVEAVRPPRNDEEERHLIDDIWPQIQKANTSSPSYARIHRHMVLVAPPEKPFSRAGKGTIKRTTTIDSFKDELNALYKTGRGQSPRQAADKPPPENESPRALHHEFEIETIEKLIHDVLAKSTDIDVSKLDPNQDLFNLGLDSLQATEITRCINQYLSSRNAKPEITTQTIYSNPSFSGLSESISSHYGKQQSLLPAVDKTKKMEKLYRDVTKEVSISNKKFESPGAANMSILLTGATGQLGSYVLDCLQKETGVSHIYCLTRGADGAQRQSTGQKSRGLGQLDPSKITHLTASLAQPYLGLKLEDYNNLTEQITDVIHVAWKVDFNLALDSFLEHVAGVQRLLEFCSNTRFGAHLFFVSSISAVGSLPGNVAEQIYKEWRAPMPTGYGQSKFIAERMIDTISASVGIPATICRVGQIAGPTRVAGMWPKREWLPSLLATSKELGVLPESLGNNNGLNWIPVDIVGQIISNTVAKTARQQNGRTRVLHVSSPTTVDWSDLIYTISAQLKPEMKIVTLQMWVDKLNECLKRGDNAAQVPAVKLYDFFSGFLDSGHTATHLEVGGQLKPWEDMLSSKAVQRSWLQNWIRQWGY